MRWSGRRESGNVEDRRGRGGMAVGGGIVGVIVLVVALLLGKNPQELLNLVPRTMQEQTASSPGAADEQSKFVRVVLADTEDVWSRIFEQMGREYEYPALVLFTGQSQSGCGFASAATGPFYCPSDQKVYIDLSFYDEL